MRRLVSIILLMAILCSCAVEAPAPSSRPDFTNVPSQSEDASKSNPEKSPSQGSDGTYQAMWISYLEWSNFDISSEAAFAQSIGTMLEHCATIGINRVIVQVRPFSDAIYDSKLFPQSHLLSDKQGKGAGFDAFAVFINEARARGIGIEAWINPYRIALNEKIPGSYAKDNLKNTHPEWVKAVGKGLYLEPSNTDVQQYIIDGVKELCEIYDIDGIQFDDYFYPTTDASFDKKEFEQLANGMSLDAWRRDNVDNLIKGVYSAIKAINPQLVFGISPQGNNDNNYNQQYSNVSLWMSENGYCDYVMPQLYWGFNYLTKSGSTQFQLKSLSEAWGAMPRAEGVKLYIGLGAWRIGAGDGGANAQDEWKTGHNIADMISTIATIGGVDGWAMYRYDSLFNNTAYPELAQSETNALQQIFS